MPEVHLAHNPLDTLREEEDFQEGTLEMLNQGGGSGYAGFKSVLDNSSSQESSGRGSSCSGSSKVWSSVPAPANKAIQGCSSARESPDEGIQTDSGTDV